MRKLLFVLVIALGLTATQWQPGELRAKEPKHYRVLATTLTSTMQKELTEAAAQGYRVIVGGPSGNEMVVVMEKVAEPPETYDYRLLATQRTSTMQEELTQAGAQGYRLIPTATLHRRRAMAEDEIALVMEKAPGPPKLYIYKLVATELIMTLEKEIGRTTAEGYKVVSMVRRGEHIVIMERAGD